MIDDDYGSIGHVDRRVEGRAGVYETLWNGNVGACAWSRSPGTRYRLE
jgi:hypothetical protein